MMKLYAPQYYKRFRCIADQCPHSCCIGWEIDIDERTAETYKQLNGSYASAIVNSISWEGEPHFKLDAHDRCPHLDEHGLCKIILNVGEEHLCDICREHPRFYNFTSVAEVGIGMSCIEAAKLILFSPDYAQTEEIGEVDSEAEPLDFDGRIARNALYTILQNASINYTRQRNRIVSEYTIPTTDDAQYLKILDSMEYLNIAHKPLFMQYSSALRPNSDEMDNYLKRFLAYLVYRHCTEAYDADDFRERLAFCLFCEQLLASLIVSKKAKDLQDVAALACMISEEIEYSEDNVLALTC